MVQEQKDVKTLPSELLLEYINTFYGYGNWQDSQFWFIGIEEGGGNEYENVQKRLESWAELGKSDLIDCIGHHKNMGSITLENQSKLHSRTWTRLILTKLGFEAKGTSKDDILNIQLNEWGQLVSDNLLIELFPLPSPGVNDWNYPSWVNLDSDLSFLSSRTLYKQTVVNQRIQNIKSKIELYKPKVVLFYGKSMKEYWDIIIDAESLESKEILDRYPISYIRKNGTNFIQCAQPTYIRAYAFWIELGKQIKLLLQEDTK